LLAIAKTFDGGAKTGTINEPHAARAAGHFKRVAFDAPGFNQRKQL